jgi:hypothetical protein
MSKPSPKPSSTDKKKKAKDPPNEQLQISNSFNWLTRKRLNTSILEAFSSPAKASNLSRLEPLPRRPRTVRLRPTTPVDTNPNNSEINNSDSLPSTKNQDDNRTQVEGNTSALSGYSPGGSSIARKSSEDLKYSDISSNPFGYPSTARHQAIDNNENNFLGEQSSTTPSTDSISPFDQESALPHPEVQEGDLEDDPEDDSNPEGDPEDDRNDDNNEDLDLPKSTPLPVTPTKAKMVTVNFDAPLEHLVKEILKYPLSHHVSLALDQSYINTFHDFRMIDIDVVHTFTYKEVSAKPDVASSKLHLTLVKAIQRCVHYCQFLQDNKHLDCDDPTKWVYEEFDTRKRPGHATYIAKLATAITPPIAGSTSLPFIPTTQKDDDAALVS